MGGRGEPPEGVPEGDPGGDDEFRSVVFDESFIRAARIQELSARERMNAAVHPARRRAGGPAGLPRQALALMLLIALAFAGAVYLGIRHPYRQTVAGGIELSMSVIPLQPYPQGGPTRTGAATATARAGSSGAPAADGPAGGSGAGVDPFAGTPVADWALGLAGIGLPNAAGTAHFTLDEVLRALSTVQQYLMESSLLPDVLAGSSTGGVRDLLDPVEQQQFDRSLAHPGDDRRHEITGWLVRFDPAEVRLAVQQVRVAGAVSFRELDASTLQVSSDHTFVYALRPAVPAAAGASSVLLFTVRRQISYRFSHSDIAGARLELADSVTQAGPMSCSANVSAALRPLFPGTAAAATTGTTATAGTGAGATAARPTGRRAGARHSGAASGPVAPSALPSGLAVDPFDRSAPAWQVCGILGGPKL